MKLAFLLTTMVIFQLWATDSYSQLTELTLKLRDAKISEVLREIERKSDYFFLYSPRLVDVERKVNIDVSNKPLKEILDEILGKKIRFAAFDRQIILTTNTESALLSAFQQQKQISGIVTEKNGAPIPGVNIVVTGTTFGTITDDSGKYMIEIPQGSKSLTFSFIGYVTQEIPITASAIYNVTLENDLTKLDEVVIIGYGSVKKSDLTGSVSSIDMDNLKFTPISSIDQGLVGRAAGTMVTQTSGMPGALASIRIRGTSSLQGGNEPLYVIDGFPVYNSTGFGNTGGPDAGSNAKFSGLSMINPADIESIEILKDASATSIYGARATNGVVLIKTKSGKSGADMITFNATYGVQKLVKEIDVMNGLQYAELVNEAYTNDGLAAFYSDAQMEEIRQNPEGTNWQDELYRTAPSQNYQLGFSGGDQKMTYSIMTNFFDQDGIAEGTNFKRYSVGVNLERNILSNLRLGTHLKLSRTISNSILTDAGYNYGIGNAALVFNPNLPVFQDKDRGIYTPKNFPGMIYPNPVAAAKRSVRENIASRLLGDISLEWEIIPNLKVKTLFGSDLFDNKANSYIPLINFESRGVAKGSINGGYTTNWLNENTISWSKEINSNHKLSLLGGLTFQEEVFENVTASAQDFKNDILEENSLQSAAVFAQPNSAKTKWSMISSIARVNYNIKERYLFTFSSRLDGSSRFGDENKYAVFPSGAFAWRLSEEDWIKRLGVFTDIKLRTSYGVIGNQEIGLYSSLATLGTTNYTIGRNRVPGAFPNKIANPNLKWEKTGQFDVGLDLGFLQNRLQITGDYYSKTTTDLIYSSPIPSTTGFTTALQNIGSMRNQGIELGIEGEILTGEFQWRTNFNISFNKNKVLSLSGEQYKDVGVENYANIGLYHRLIVGEPVGLFYGYIFDGIFQNQAELDAGPQSPVLNGVGFFRYVDLNGPEGVPDGKIDPSFDRTVIGDPNPDFFGGMTHTLSYKGFDFNMFFQYSYGNDIFNASALKLKSSNGDGNVYADVVNRWTPTNPSNEYHKATMNVTKIFSSNYIEDGSYLKLKTLSFGYSFPNLKVKHISDLNLYVTANNYLVFTKYRGYDPEVSYKGASNLEIGEDYGGYPQAKTIMLGVRLNVR